MKTPPLVFIHGMYMTPLCWEHWLDRFQQKGYECLAPAWPGRDSSVPEIRDRQPDTRDAALTLTAVLESLTDTIRRLATRPVLIGHSMGGLAAQILLQRGLGAAGVAINSAPPQGVFSARWSFLKSNWPHITPLARRSRPIVMPFSHFQYAFANSLPLREQEQAFARYIVPESRRVPAESLTGTAHIDFTAPHPPLLIVAGGADHIIPPTLNRANYTRYRHPESVTDFKEFAGRDHFIIGESGWEEVADFVEDWLDRRLSHAPARAAEEPRAGGREIVSML